MRGVRIFFCYARTFSGNSVRLNKTKIRWKGIFLEVCVVFNLSQISLLSCVVLNTSAMLAGVCYIITSTLYRPLIA